MRPAALLALFAACGIAWQAAAPLRQASMQRVATSEASLHAQRCLWPSLEYRPRVLGAEWDSDLSHWPRSVELLVGQGRILRDAGVGSGERYRYRVSLSTPGSVRLPVLAFPGWRVEGHGSEEVSVGESAGRVVLHLPAGEHDLRLLAGAPRGQSTGWLLAALGALAVFVVQRRRRVSPPAAPRPAAGADP